MHYFSRSEVPVEREILAKTHAKVMLVFHTHRLKKKKTQTVLITPYVSFQSLHLSPKQSSLPLGDRERRLQHLQFIQYLSLSVSNRANQSHLLQQGLQGMLYKEQTLSPGLPADTQVWCDWLMSLQLARPLKFLPAILLSVQSSNSSMRHKHCPFPLSLPSTFLSNQQSACMLFSSLVSSDLQFQCTSHPGWKQHSPHAHQHKIQIQGLQALRCKRLKAT